MVEHTLMVVFVLFGTASVVWLLALADAIADIKPVVVASVVWAGIVIGLIFGTLMANILLTP